MAYSSHALLEFGGHLVEGEGKQEIWACGIRCVSFNTGVAPAVGDLDDMLQSFTDGTHGHGGGLIEWFGLAANHIADGATLEWTKLNNIGPDGKYSEPGVTHVRDFAAHNGGVTHSMPNFLSVAYTWETGLVRGRAHRGRIYPPNFAWNYAGATMDTPDAQSNAQAGARLLQLVNDAHNADATDRLQAVVASKLGGEIHAITGVTSDNVLDVQRRRKNRVTSIRSTIEAIPTG